MTTRNRKTKAKQRQGRDWGGAGGHDVSEGEERQELHVPAQEGGVLQLELEAQLPPVFSPPPPSSFSSSPPTLASTRLKLFRVPWGRPAAVTDDVNPTTATPPRPRSISNSNPPIASVHPPQSGTLPSSSSTSSPATAATSLPALTSNTPVTRARPLAAVSFEVPPSTAAVLAANMTAEPQAPTRANLKAWWQHFTLAQKFKGQPHQDKGEPPHTVFGKTLSESLKYAKVQISTANANGELYVWGYIPVVVAKCGLFLKENATEVEGTFRVNGSTKRMRELQAIFETPPRYGKSIDWKKENYTTHDVASVFRRYLTQMPEPVIPHDMYFEFRDAIAKKPYNQDEVIAKYKALIGSMHRSNQYLLLYVLDLLSVFARKSDKNLMTAQNLAVIFQPGLISHPTHELQPTEHQLSQEVLEFLIEHQDWFMLDIPPPPPKDKKGGHGQSSSDMSSDEDMGGGWKLIGNPARERGGATSGTGKVGRRRTTVERDRQRVHEKHSAELSPVVEVPGSAPGVTRSRTLPSQRSGRGAEDERPGRLLRKARRVSEQPKSRNPSAPPAPPAKTSSSS